MSTIKNPSVDSLMRDTVEASLLRDAAGRAMFCGSCEAILDWRKTVLVTVYAAMADKPERPVRSYLQCAHCYDTRAHVITEALATLASRRPDISTRVEVLDGRAERFEWIE